MFVIDSYIEEEYKKPTGGGILLFQIKILILKITYYQV